ncbi:hypothetical protein D3C84_481630 [compost metagenome]
MGRVNVDAVVGETLGQCDGGFRQHAFVLINVLAIDDEQRFLAGIGVRAHAVTGLETGRRSGQATAVSRDGAIGITGFFSPHHGEASAQFNSFLTRYQGLCIKGQCRQE